MAKAVAFFNLSVLHVIRNELDIAYRYFNMCVPLFDKRQPAYTYYMKLYLDLLDGNRQSLQYVLKDHFGHVTLNRSTQLVSNTATSINVPRVNVTAAAVATTTPTNGANSQQSATILNTLHQQQLQQHLQQQQQQPSSHFTPQTPHFSQLQQQQQQQNPQFNLQAQQHIQQLQIQLLQQQLQQQQSQLLQSQTLNQFINNHNGVGLTGAASNSAIMSTLAAVVAAEKRANVTTTTAGDH